MASNSCELFISYAEEDDSLVRQLASVLEKELSLDGKVFVSGHGSIKSYQEFPSAIKLAIQQAKAVIVVVTPNSRWRPWVHFETGGAHFAKAEGKERIRVFVVRALGIEPEGLPSNLQFKTAKNLADPKSLRELLHDLRKVFHLGSQLVSPSGKIRSLASLAAGPPGWDLVEPAMVAKKTASSPFEILKLLPAATTSLFVAGPTLHFVACGPYAKEIKAAIFAFLKPRHGRDRQVRLLIQHPDRDSAGIRAWEPLCPVIADDVCESASEFRRWLAEAKVKRINTGQKRRLDIRGTTLVPITMTIIDPEQPTRKVVFTPVLHNAILPIDRPTFAIYHDRDLVRYFASTFSDQFNKGEPIAAEGCKRPWTHRLSNSLRGGSGCRLLV